MCEYLFSANDYVKVPDITFIYMYVYNTCIYVYRYVLVSSFFPLESFVLFVFIIIILKCYQSFFFPVMQ